MGAMNRVFLMGNLTRDPILRKTPGGLSVSEMGMAVSERFRNKEGQIVESTCFAEIVAWGRQAETCQQYLAKGASVMVEGRLQFDQWQTDTGEKRSRLKIRADRVQFLGRRTKAGDAAEPAESATGTKSSKQPDAVDEEVAPPPLF